MKDVLFEKHGGPDGLHLAEVTDPTRGPRDLVVVLRGQDVKAVDDDDPHRGGGCDSSRGGFGIQLVKDLGARVVTVGSGGNHDCGRCVGGDRGSGYNKEDFTTAVSDCDVVFDTGGGDVQVRSYAVLKPGGRLVWIAAAPAGFQPTPKGVHVPRPKVKRDPAELERVLAL